MDGTKFASFDGTVLEVSGLSGTSESMRISLNRLDSVAVASTSAEEFLFIVKTHTGGFSLVISTDKKTVWDELVKTVMEAKSRQAS
jgi:hypothetical protein